MKLQKLLSLRIMVLLSGLLLASACTAKSAAPAPAPYTEGKQYVVLPAPHQRYSPEGKVEVAEVFSYGCIHCAQFAPLAQQLRKSLPKGAVLKLVPAPFSAEWLPFARAYYAADKLGVVERTHLALFQAKFDAHYPINTMGELADFYAREGVDRAAFMAAATSPAATAKLKGDLLLIQQWGVDSTPTMVVNGKYRITGVSSHEEMAAVALWLAKRELSGGK